MAYRLLCPWDSPRQEYWNGLPFPSPGDLPNPGIKEVQITSMRYHLTPIRMVTFRKQQTATTGCGEAEAPVHHGGNVKRYPCCRKTAFLKKLKLELPHDQQPTSEHKPK